MNIQEESLALHAQHKGKLEVHSTVSLQNHHDLALAYTPGVAAVSQKIAENPDSVYDYTIKQHTVAVVTDGSAVLGLGNVGPKAALPVMEGKAILLKQLAGVDAVPLCLDTQDVSEIVQIVRNISPTFGAILLEDIAAPRCFEIEQSLQDIGIPVFHDDQHGTAIVVVAALHNAARVIGKNVQELHIVVNGAGAAGTAIVDLLIRQRVENSSQTITVCDSRGIIYRGRPDTEGKKAWLAEVTNPTIQKGTLKDAIQGADVFIGVSAPNVMTAQMVQSMASNAIVFALSNPTPEIHPDEARKGGAAVIATGRSDYLNQVNNVLAFPGIFHGALQVKALRITDAMKSAAVEALIELVPDVSENRILPDPLSPEVARKVSEKVIQAAD